MPFHKDTIKSMTSMSKDQFQLKESSKDKSHTPLEFQPQSQSVLQFHTQFQLFNKSQFTKNNTSSKNQSSNNNKLSFNNQSSGMRNVTVGGGVVGLQGSGVWNQGVIGQTGLVGLNGSGVWNNGGVVGGIAGNGLYGSIAGRTNGFIGGNNFLTAQVGAAYGNVSGLNINGVNGVYGYNGLNTLNGVNTLNGTNVLTASRVGGVTGARLF